MQSSKMLRCRLNPGSPEIVAAQGVMVAYQGQMDFAYQGSGGGMRMLKKIASGEGGDLMKVRGEGEVFLARQAHNIFLIELEGEAITLNTGSLLAFDGSLRWDIRAIGNVGVIAGGLFNLYLEGSGTVAVTSDGPPMLLDCSQQPTYVDPHAAVCWSPNLTPTLKNDFKMSSLIGRGSGESFQLGFYGPGFVVVQPSEGVPGSRFIG
ncbi:MAG: AIM24 family protein [Flaviflexus sp.]|uniref:AIM24 family protein n=1 Tax=Flaviflexus sp. TaxID=1969482 RepID=UPI00352E8FB9